MLTQKTIMSNVAQSLDVISNLDTPIEYSTTVAPLPLYHIYAFSLCLGLMPATQGHCVLIPDPRNIPPLSVQLRSPKFDDFLRPQFLVCSPDYRTETSSA